MAASPDLHLRLCNKTSLVIPKITCKIAVIFQVYLDIRGRQMGYFDERKNVEEYIQWRRVTTVGS